MRNFVFGAAAVVALAGAASAANLAAFSFELSPPSGPGPHTADAGLFAASSNIRGSHVSGATVYDNPVGNGSVESFSSNNWAIGDFYEIRTNTLGYTAITFQWDQVSSNTGPRDFNLQISTDGGANYVNVLINQISRANASPAWSSGTPTGIDTHGPTALGAAAANLADLRIRITMNTSVSANGGTVASGGTSRIDDVVVAGTLIPTPGALALMAGAGLVGLRRRRA
ncbi:MAG TPA: hypothetical protein VG797_06265 [Phycisphaerales bacterium]|nr:hypothetical protein [Phycisphaerales bacterium]